MGKYEVTFAQWDACVSAGGCKHRPDDAGWGRGNRPVINVLWDDVQEYVTWLNRTTGQRYRLPTEAEWEYAARGGTTTDYYWGNEIGRNNTNCDGCGSQWDGKQTAPVGSFGANPYGLHDMLGNVLEWTSGCWEADCIERVLRGGSWSYSPEGLRVSNRGWRRTVSRFSSIGFRLVLEN